VAYSAEISRVNPGCIVFVIDQSGSMSDRLEVDTKADEVATILNRTLVDLITRCAREEGVRDYFHVGVIGYGAQGPHNALGSVGENLINPLSLLEANPLRIEKRNRKVPDGAGGLVEVETDFPVWFEPIADGGTPMRAALLLAAHTLADWCDVNPNSFPPVVLHLTDGESTDGDPEPVSRELRQISTDDGEVILMNAHISDVSSREIAFPDSDSELPDQYARLLYAMSSTLAPQMQDRARSLGFNVNDSSRAFVLNARVEQIINFFDIGTRPSNLR
jgi:hypothetical protein